MSSSMETKREGSRGKAKYSGHRKEKQKLSRSNKPLTKALGTSPADPQTELMICIGSKIK